MTQKSGAAPARGRDESTPRRAPQRTGEGRQESHPARASAAHPGASDTTTELRTRVLRALEAEIGAEACHRYFNGTAELNPLDAGLEVVVPSDFLARNLDRRFGGSIRRAAARVLNADASGLEVRFRVDGDLGDGAQTPSQDQEAPSAAPRAREAEGSGRRGAQDDNGARPGSSARRNRPAWRKLDEFIVGRTNRFAYSAAEQIAAGDRRFSPLFVQGVCGMGKTHLLQGVAERFRRTHPGARVKFTTAEAFTNGYIAAMHNQSLDAFRQRYRNVDLLCIDDVHFVASKRKTQSELLHTFDAIDLDGKLVALASDEHPHDIEQISTGLTSRFLQGAIVNLEPPDDELRRRILLEIGTRRGLPLDEDAAGLLSEHASREAMVHGRAVSVRELIGLVTQVEAVARLLPDLDGDHPRGVALVRAALGLTSGPGAASGSRAGGMRRPVRLDLVIDQVCDRLGVTREEFASKRRSKPVVLARALTVYLARRLTNHSFPEIARAMARPNHSSVITMHNRIAGQIDAGETTEFGSVSGPIPIADLAAQLEHLIQREAGRSEPRRAG